MPTHEKLTTPELIRPIKTLLIANRGEIAVRAAKACERRDIRAVIPYSELPSERESYATRLADENIERGWELAPLPGINQEESYANPHVMIQTANTFGADAVFLGYGFLAENAEFVRMCEENKPPIRVLAPSSEAMDKLGNKIKARDIAKNVKIGKIVKIPVLEGTSLLTTYQQMTKAAEHIGFPIMVKDPDLGGGMGNLIARNREELENAYRQLRIGKNKGLFLERFIENAVHVEIQIAGDNYGNVIALGERDCTMQRKHQKVIEESPSPYITDHMRNDMRLSAVNLAKEVGYAGVGTVEFVIDRDKKHGDDLAWYFMEVNPRIQVEHPVTEEQTRIVTPVGTKKIDIVDLMIDIAEGKKLPFTQEQIKEQGHTIEARIYAEDTSREFIPQRGELNEFKIPKILGVRVDKGYEENDQITEDYDSTLCKAIAHAKTRGQAIVLLTQFLQQLEIAGVTTNREFLIDALRDPFQNPKATTTSLEDWWMHRQTEKAQPIHEFIDNHPFTRYAPSRSLNLNALPLNLTIKSANSERVMTYGEYLQKYRKETGQDTAAEFGILKRDGIQFVVYYLNSDFIAGTIGKAEASAFQDACRLAHEKNLPLVTISTSAGMRQHENDHALQLMSGMVGALSDYPPLFHVDVAVGPNYGGFLASVQGKADIKIAVDDPEEKDDKKKTKIGFASPYAVALVEGKKPATTNAQDAYKVMDASTHSAPRHFQKRAAADMVLSSPKEASDSITHILHLLKKKYPNVATDPHLVYKPPEESGFIRSASQAARYDAPDTYHPSWIPKQISKLWDHYGHQNSEEIIFVSEYENTLSVLDRRRIIKHPGRPTALDIIASRARVFDDKELLTTINTVRDATQVPPNIEALVTLDGEPLFVMAQERQRKKKVSEYDPQRPADWRHTKRMLKFAQKLKLPVLLLGDTEGAACDTKAEDENQVGEIAEVLDAMYQYPYPIISINIGKKGSGGGATYIWHADAAAAWENATFWVSDLPVLYTIITKKPFIDEEHATKAQMAELETVARQLTDATAQGQQKAGYIDHVIREGKGGAHVDPRIVASETKKWLRNILPGLRVIPPEELKRRRKKRRERIMDAGTVTLSKGPIL